MGPGKLALLSLVLLLTSVQPAAALTGSVQLISPGDGVLTNKTNTTLPFTFMFTDPHNVTANCSLNLSGKRYGPVPATNNTQKQIFSASEFKEGANVWNITCVNGTAIASETRTLLADRVAPVVTIPPSGVPVSMKYVNLLSTANYTDGQAESANCSFLVNDTVMKTKVFQNLTVDIFTVHVSDGFYKIEVSCTDSAGNTGYSNVLFANKTSPLPMKINSPQNTTYESGDGMVLNFEHFIESLPYMYYIIDGVYVYVSLGNKTIDVGTYGSHSLTIVLTDISFGNQSSTIHFTIEEPEGPPSGLTAIDFLSPSTDTINRNFLTVNVSTDFGAEWCKLSTDGGSNVTMTNVTDKSWYYSLTGLSEGEHKLVVWCSGSGVLIKEEESFRVVVAGFNIDIETPLNRTYWGTDSFTILVHTTLDSQLCEFFLNSYGPVSMNKYDSRMWYYNMSGTGEGTYKLIVGCYDSSGFYNSSSVSFTLRSDECESNWTGICTESQYCANSKCVDLDCGGCSYAEGHECKAHECCSDDDCLSAQACVSNKCEGVPCDCGVIEGHECIEYGCCSNFDCEINEKCDTKNHTCVKKALTIIMPGSVRAGEEFTISLVDEDMKPVPDAKIKVEYKSGVTESLTTDDLGSVYLVPKESGPIIVMADLAGYDRETITADVIPGIDTTALLLLLVLAAGGLTGFFYWKQMPPLTLSKDVKGQEVLLKVKNRSGEYIDNVLIYDTVPRGAFISCGVNPRVEDFGNETHLSWFAALNGGEEIMINYQAVQTSDSFSVRVGDDEYQSGFGPVKIMMMLLGRLHREKAETPPLE